MRAAVVAGSLTGRARAGALQARRRVQPGSMPKRRLTRSAEGAVRKPISARASRTWPASRADADREGGDRLEGRRREADDVDPRLVEEFAELLDADLRPAAGDEGRDRNAGLGLDEARPFAVGIEPPLLRHFEQMGSARAGRIADRTRGGECGLQRLGVRKVRPRRAGLDGERHRRADKGGERPGQQEILGPSFAITSAASTTRSNRSPARTRFAASTPPTASIEARLPVSSSYPAQARPARAASPSRRCR